MYTQQSFIQSCHLLWDNRYNWDHSVKQNKPDADKYCMYFPICRIGLKTTEGGLFEKKKGTAGGERCQGECDQNMLYACVKMS